MSILVACPTASSKDYVLLDYLRCFKNFQTLEDIDLFMVDTTQKDPEGVYSEKIRNLGIDCVHIDPPFFGWCLLYTIGAAWEVIIKEAWRREVDYIFSLEVDVLCPPETIEVMLALMESRGVDMVSHAYPYPGYPLGVNYLGCTLLRRSLFEPRERIWEKGKLLFEDYLFQKPLTTGHPVLFTGGYLDVEHRDSNPRGEHERL